MCYRRATILVTAMLGALYGVAAGQGNDAAGSRLPLNQALLALPANRWVKLHEQQPGDKVRFQFQEHGGSCFDTKRCRLVLFGSNTHGRDWTNTPLIFDVPAGEWQRCYTNDAPDSYTVNAAGLAVAGAKGDHPWATHTFGTLNYDPGRDEMVVACYPAHMVPGRFSNALKDVWGKVKRHPTWTFRFADNTWAPLDCEPRHFFPNCAAWDSDRQVVVGYGGAVAELGGEPRTWKTLGLRALTGWHNNAVYDEKHKAVLVFGSNENSNDMVVYRPGTGEHRKLPTPGLRPPKDQHCPMAYEPEAGRTVVVVDRVGDDKTSVAETWLYDLGADSWAQLPEATIAYGMGMNYCMEYDPRHKVCLLVAANSSAPGRPVTVYALKVDATRSGKENPSP